MCPQNFEQVKILRLVRLQFFNQLIDQLAQLRFTFAADQRLFVDDLIDQNLDWDLRCGRGGFGGRGSVS